MKKITNSDNERIKWLNVVFNYRNNVTEVIFVPYAKVNGDYDGYTKLMAGAISKFGKILLPRIDFR